MPDKIIPVVLPSPLAVVSQEFVISGAKIVYTAREGATAEMIVETAQQFSYAIRLLMAGKFEPAENAPERPDYGESSVHGEPRVVFYILDKIPVKWNDGFVYIKPNKFTEETTVAAWLDLVHDMMLAAPLVAEHLLKIAGDQRMKDMVAGQASLDGDEQHAAPPTETPETILFEDAAYIVVPLVANYRDIPEYEVGTNVAFRIVKIEYTDKKNLEGERQLVYNFYCKLPGDHLKYPIAMTIYADNRMLTGNESLSEEVATAAPTDLDASVEGDWYLLGKTYLRKSDGKQAFWFTHLIGRTYAQP